MRNVNEIKHTFDVPELRILNEMQREARLPTGSIHYAATILEIKKKKKYHTIILNSIYLGTRRCGWPRGSFVRPSSFGNLPAV
jgi:hypothetical protein